MTVQTRLMTVEEFEQFSDAPENSDRRFELIDGEIVEKMPTEEHAVIAATISGFIWSYLRANELGGRVAVEPRHRVPEDDYNARLPDIAFTSKERALPLVKKGSVPQMPDFAVEIKSPDDSYAKLRKKAAYYLQNGTRLVWLVYPEKRLVEVYRSESNSEILTAEDTLDGGEVLPNFTLPVKDIFVE